jgi:diguanylate cyclase (GGDEF)-like protein/PAS domain S-box-containing protein
VGRKGQPIIRGISQETLLASLEGQVVVMDPEYRILYANQAVLDRLGRSREEVLGEYCYRVFHAQESPCYLAGVECPVRLALESGEEATVVHRHARADGTTCYLEIRAQPLRTASGQTAALLHRVREVRPEERYHRFFETARDGMVVFSRGGHLVDVNPALCRMLGYSREELLRMKATDFVSPELAASFLDQREGSKPVEIAVSRKDGSVLLADVNVSHTKLGGVSLFLCIVHDVTEKRRWEKELAERARRLAASEEQYRTLFENAGDALLVIEEDTTIAMVNRHFEEMMGYRREEVEGKMSFLRLIPEDEQERMLELHRRRREGSHDVPSSYRVWGVSKEGQKILGDVSVSMIPGTRRSLVAVRDMTETFRLQEELTEQARKLAASEEQYRILFEHAGDALAVVEADGTISMANARFQEFMGYSREEIEGRLTVVDVVYEEDLEEVLRVRQRRLTGTPLTHHQCRLRRKDGTVRWVAVTGVLMPGTQRSFVSFRDITEERRLQEELARRNQELEALNAAAALASHSSDVGAALTRILRKALEVTGQSSGQVYLLDEEQGKLFIRAHVKSPERLLKATNALGLGEGFGGWVAQTGKPLFISDISKDPRLTRPEAVEVGIRSLACVPLVSGGRVLGVMALGGTKVREFSAEEQRLLLAMGNEIGVAVERVQLLQATQEKAEEMEALISVTRELASTLDLQAVLDRTLAIMCQHVGADNGFLCLLNREKGELTASNFWGEQAARSGRVWKVGEGVAGWVAQHQQPIVCDDIATDTRIQNSLALAAGYQSVLGVPLEVRGRLLGVAVIAKRAKGGFTEAHLRLLTAYGVDAAIAIENALLHEEVRRQAATDELTRLANRRAFYHRLGEEQRRAKRYGRPLALIFVDVDDLKLVNDRYGHLQGDALLRHVATTLLKGIRETDLAARFGGDEFVVILPETGKEEAQRVVERVLTGVTPCELAGTTVPWSMSIGIAWLPVDGNYDVDLVRLADEASYQAKAQRGGWACASP